LIGVIPVNRKFSALLRYLTGQFRIERTIGVRANSFDWNLLNDALSADNRNPIRQSLIECISSLALEEEDEDDDGVDEDDDDEEDEDECDEDDDAVDEDDDDEEDEEECDENDEE
jgi:hypothetical protein